MRDDYNLKGTMKVSIMSGPYIFLKCNRLIKRNKSAVGAVFGEGHELSRLDLNVDDDDKSTIGAGSPLLLFLRKSCFFKT